MNSQEHYYLHVCLRVCMHACASKRQLGRWVGGCCKGGGGFVANTQPLSAFAVFTH